MSNLVWVAIPVPSAPAFASPRDIVFCPIEGKWVLVGLESGAGKAYESVDGITWTELVVPYVTAATGFKGVRGIDLTVDNGRIVIVTDNRVYEKDVADVWQEINPADFLDCTGLGYLPGVGFCALTSFLGSPKVFDSTDGVTWTATGSQPVAGTKIRNGGGYFLRLGTAGVSLSSDALTWSSASPGVGFGSAYVDVTYHNVAGVWFGVLSASGPNHTRIYKSTLVTGEVWNSIYSFGDSASPIGVQALIYDPYADQLVLSTFYDIFYTSDDQGVTWVRQNTPAASAGVSYSGVGNSLTCLASDDFIFVGSTNVESLFPTTGTLPNSPTDLSGTEGADDITLNWTNGGSTIIGNLIDYKTNDDLDFIPIATSEFTTNPTSAVISHDLIPNYGTTSIIFRVRSYNTNGISLEADAVEWSIIFQIGVGGSILNSYSSVTFLISGTPPVIIETMGGGSGTGLGTGLEFGDAAVVVYITEPSGIYTLTPGLRHDTLYNRAGSVSTVDLAIPEPFFQSAYLGDE